MNKEIHAWSGLNKKVGIAGEEEAEAVEDLLDSLEVNEVRI